MMMQQQEEAKSTPLEQITAFREDTKRIFKSFDDAIGGKAKPIKQYFHLVDRFQLGSKGVLIDGDALLQYVLKLGKKGFLVSSEYGYATAHVMELLHRILKSVLEFIGNKNSIAAGSEEKEIRSKAITLLFFNDMGLFHPLRECISPLTYLLLRKMFIQEACSMSDVRCEVINESCFGKPLSSINFFEQVRHELIFSCKDYPKAYISQFSAINISLCDVQSLCADGEGMSSGLEHNAKRQVLKFLTNFDDATKTMIDEWIQFRQSPLFAGNCSGDGLRLVDKLYLDCDSLCGLISEVPDSVDGVDLSYFKEAHKKAIGFQALRLASKEDPVPMSPSLPEEDLSVLVKIYLMKFTELCVRNKWSPREDADSDSEHSIIQLCHLWDGRLIASWYMHIKQMDVPTQHATSCPPAKPTFPSNSTLFGRLCDLDKNQSADTNIRHEPNDGDNDDIVEDDDDDNWQTPIIYKNPCHSDHPSFQMGDDGEEEEGEDDVAGRIRGPAHGQVAGG